jgi:uncharacterized membrane protein YedE/YeeE
MKIKLAGFLVGTLFGFIIAWARLSDPQVIRNMLLLREPDVFLLMGSGVLVAALGVRLLRDAGARAFMTGEPIAWSIERPSTRHFAGSALFGLGWSLAGTCPGPVAAMIGEGRLGGVVVAAGLLGGVVLQGALAKKRSARTEVLGTAGAMRVGR